MFNNRLSGFPLLQDILEIVSFVFVFTFEINHFLFNCAKRPHPKKTDAGNGSQKKSPLYQIARQTLVVLTGPLNYNSNKQEYFSSPQLVLVMSGGK